MAKGIEKMYYNGDGYLTVIYSNNLLENYSELLNSIFNKKFSGVKFNKKNNITIEIRIPTNFSDFSLSPKATEEDKQQIESVYKAIDEFEMEAYDKAMEKRCSSFEILPLEGYPSNKLAEEVKDAVHSKRNFCIVDTYDSYQRYVRGEIFEIKYININYLTDDYCNAAILVVQQNLEELKKLFIDRMETKGWL